MDDVQDRKVTSGPACKKSRGGTVTDTRNGVRALPNVRQGCIAFPLFISSLHSVGDVVGRLVFLPANSSGRESDGENQDSA
jgi:hypothetical protein